MIVACKRPMLIVEGQGDVSAIPRLVRDTLAQSGIYDISPAPRPKSHVDVVRLKRSGELERYVDYAARDEGDSVLVALDCEDFCPAEISHDFAARVSRMRLSKKVGIVLFRSEFESLFLYCIDEIIKSFPDYHWAAAPIMRAIDVEAIRDAKGTLSRLMRRDRAYKETRDQVKFLTALNYDKLRRQPRSFQHFESTLLWLAGQIRLDDVICPAPLAT